MQFPAHICVRIPVGIRMIKNLKEAKDPLTAWIVLWKSKRANESKGLLSKQSDIKLGQSSGFMQTSKKKDG